MACKTVQPERPCCHKRILHVCSKIPHCRAITSKTSRPSHDLRLRAAVAEALVTRPALNAASAVGLGAGRSAVAERVVSPTVARSLSSLLSERG